jgi:hypothetical protein
MWWEGVDALRVGDMQAIGMPEDFGVDQVSQKLICDVHCFCRRGVLTIISLMASYDEHFYETVHTRQENAFTGKRTMAKL